MRAWGAVAALGGVAVLATSLSSQRAPHRQAGEAVGSAELRTLQGLLPDESLLFNGGGVTPAAGAKLPP
jgi:hypothetical protein